MNRSLILTAALVSGLALGQSAFAADSSTAAALAPSQFSVSLAPNAPLSRAEVKALARQAERSGAIPRGQANWPDAQLPTVSILSRAQVKAETRLAEAHGLIPRGEAQEARVAYAPSTLDRAEVKAEARQAERLGLIPRGESNIHQPQ